MRFKLGFTLIELLAVIAIAGILLGVGANSFLGARKTLNLDSAAQTISQDIQFGRSQALAKGNAWRLRIVDTHSYVLEESVSGTWQNRRTRQFPSLTLLNVATNNSLTFSTRSYVSYNPIGLEIRISDGATTKRIVTSMVGSTYIN